MLFFTRVSCMCGPRTGRGGWRALQGEPRLVGRVRRISPQTLLVGNRPACHIVRPAEKALPKCFLGRPPPVRFVRSHRCGRPAGFPRAAYRPARWRRRRRGSAVRASSRAPMPMARSSKMMSPRCRSYEGPPGVRVPRRTMAPGTRVRYQAKSSPAERLLGEDDGLGPDDVLGGGVDDAHRPLLVDHRRDAADVAELDLHPERGEHLDRGLLDELRGALPGPRRPGSAACR